MGNYLTIKHALSSLKVASLKVALLKSSSPNGAFLTIFFVNIFENIFNENIWPVFSRLGTTALKKIDFSRGPGLREKSIFVF